MSETCDLAVVGAGPAGMAAAALAARHGASVVLLDENARPGGQVYRAAPNELPVLPGPDRRAGDRLRDVLAGSGAEVKAGCRVWSLGGGPLTMERAPAPFRVDGIGLEGPTSLTARALLLCCGTYERVVPFPGWTLPGVLGLAAATILLKSQAVLPGRRVVVAGCGPLLAAVAAGVLKAGGEVLAVVDLARRADWLRVLPAMAGHPALLARGADWLGRVTRARIPVLSAHRVVRADGVETVSSVTVAPLSDGPARTFACDALCVGHGLVPATEAARLFGAEHVFRQERGGWVPVLDAWQRTSVPLLFVAGDGAGVAGADAAPLTGQLAALGALRDLGLITAGGAEGKGRTIRRRLARVQGFGAAMAAMMVPPADLTRAVPPDCIVCRCEDVTRAEIEAALDAGAQDVNQLKHFTRCGMGPCQGRMCGETAAELVATRVGSRETAGRFTPRLPLRPVPMEALLGRFDYADIPVPAPAPI